MLEKVNNPGDIKGLSYAELKTLAYDVRQLIIQAVARQGGHLASSLGAVELTLALHSCLDLPEDSIVFAPTSTFEPLTAIITLSSGTL